MIDREKVIKGLECCSKGCSGGCTYSVEGGDCCTALAADALKLLKAQEPITGETSDGYHTFNELYHHRAVLFSVIVMNYPDKAWKSKKHHDGTMYNGMFIVGIDTPDGQATYHYDIDPYWDMFKCHVLDNAPEWDGHTAAQAIERIGKLKAQEPHVLTLEEMFELRFDDVVYFEALRTNFVIGGIIIDVIPRMPNGEIGLVQFRHTQEPLNNADLEFYGKTWRCWSARPTDEQREAMKWDD